MCCDFILIAYGFIFQYNMMADTFVKKSPFYTKYKSLITTSTPYRSINDSGYNTPNSTLSSNASSNLNLISEVSLSFNHTSPGLQLSSNTHRFPLDRSRRKLEDITNYAITDSDVNILPSSTREEELSPSKKFKPSRDIRLHCRINNFPKDNDRRFLKRKTVTSHQNVNHERISVEGRENVDFMYFLSERHHFEPVTEKIFSFLSGSDVISMSMVSRIWCNAVQKSPMAQKKKLMYLKLSKENRNRCDGRDRSTLVNKGCLANISNVMRSPSKRDAPQRSPPVSPSKYRFHVFQKASNCCIEV